MSFLSGVTLVKLDPNPYETERSKFSLGMMTSEGFVISYNWLISLVLLDTDVALDCSTFLTVSSFFWMEVIDVLTRSSLFLTELIYA